MAKIMTKGGVVIEMRHVPRALELGEELELQAPMFSTPEEIRQLSVTNLLTLLSPIYWWRMLLDVGGNLLQADSVRMSSATARISGVLEVKFLELHRWVLIRRVGTRGEAAHWVRLTQPSRVETLRSLLNPSRRHVEPWHLVDEKTGRPFHLDGYHQVRREALIGLVEILAVKEDQDSRESAAATRFRKYGIRRGHYRRQDVCGRIGHQAPPAPLLDRTPDYTWVSQMSLA